MRRPRTKRKPPRPLPKPNPPPHSPFAMRRLRLWLASRSSKVCLLGIGARGFSFSPIAGSASGMGSARLRLKPCASKIKSGRLAEHSVRLSSGAKPHNSESRPSPPKSRLLAEHSVTDKSTRQTFRIHSNADQPRLTVDSN